jgi:Uncharacterised nucleotidyltransferase
MEEQRTRHGKGTGPDALRDFVARLHPVDCASTARVDAATAEVLAAFATAGVDALLLKGAALANLLYVPGEHRDYSDADLLVAPSQLDAAERCLEKLGYSNADTVTGVDDVGGVVHAHTWIRAGSTDSSMIDLHRWLPGSESPPAVAWDALLARTTRIDVAGRQAAVLDRAGQAMHLAIHAAQHGTAYEKPLAELSMALTRWATDVWDTAAELANEIGATHMFATGLRLLPEGAAEASRLELPSTAELDWTIRHRSARPRGTFHIQALAEASGLGERLRILRLALLPARTWIRYEYRWARHGRLRLIAAYAVHLARAPGWAARACLFRWRARRAASRAR